MLLERGYDKLLGRNRLPPFSLLKRPQLGSQYGNASPLAASIKIQHLNLAST